MLQAASGQRWLALVSRHFSEVRGLINHQKRVATCWHRMSGPQLLRTLAPALTGTGELTVRDDSDAIASWRRRASRFLDLLERRGSPELADAVRKHRQTLLAYDLGSGFSHLSASSAM